MAADRLPGFCVLSHPRAGNGGASAHDRRLGGDHGSAAALMPSYIRVTGITPDDAVRQLQGVEPAIVVGFRRWFIRDVRRKAKRRNWGFTDRSGDLRRSIRARTTTKAGTLTASEPYARLVEFGRGGRRAFLLPAIESELPRLNPRIARQLQRLQGR